MTVKWEYRWFPVHHYHGDEHGNWLEPRPPEKQLAQDVEHWIAQLNDLGSEGWEVVGPIETVEFMGVTNQFLLLKRQLPDA